VHAEDLTSMPARAYSHTFTFVLVRFALLRRAGIVADNVCMGSIGTYCDVGTDCRMSRVGGTRTCVVQPRRILIVVWSRRQVSGVDSGRVKGVYH
jgi:hypothetical protein